MESQVDRLLVMFEASPVLVALYDSFDRLRYANKAFRSVFFIEPDEEPLWGDMMRRNYAAGRGTVIAEPDFEAWLISTQSRRGKTGYRAFETDLVDGRWFWMTETVQDDGSMLCVAFDMSGLEVDGRALRQDRDVAVKASFTDELTGIANRRFVMARLEDMLRRPTHGHAAIGCACILDLDNFKYINDRFGHPTGDLILRDFATEIQRHVRRSDCFGRVGGEEFVLVLPGTSRDEAALIVERMLASIRRSRPLKERGDLSYSFSAGIASAMPGDSADGLLERADRALYAAKMAGRNRIESDAA